MNNTEKVKCIHCSQIILNTDKYCVKCGVNQITGEETGKKKLLKSFHAKKGK